MTQLIEASTRLTLVQRAIVLLRLQIQQEGDRLARVILQRCADKPACPKARCDLSGAPDEATVQAVLSITVAASAVLCTDGTGLLGSGARALDTEHQAVNLSQGQRACGAWNLQNVNAYHGRLKQLMRRFDAVVTCDLTNCLAWFRVLQRMRSTAARADISLPTASAA